MSTSVKINDAFERQYECDQLSELSGCVPSNRFYYPGGNAIGGHDGIIFEVTPYSGGESWTGVFAFGENSSSKFTGAFSHPDPNKLCIVSRGAGVIVNVIDPTSWELIDCHPICHVVTSRKHEILVFGNLTEFIAYGKDGIAWRSQRVGWSDLNVTEVSDDYINGFVWDIRSEENVDFCLELATGSHSGGIDEA